MGLNISWVSFVKEFTPLSTLAMVPFQAINLYVYPPNLDWWDENLTSDDEYIFLFHLICFVSPDLLLSFQILINGRDPTAVDIEGAALPTLVYLAREKRPQHHHNFKAGAMNALVTFKYLWWYDMLPCTHVHALHSILWFTYEEKGIVTNLILDIVCPSPWEFWDIFQIS